MKTDFVVIRKVEEKDIQKIVDLHKKVVEQENGKYYSKQVIEEWLSQINYKNVKQQLPIKNTYWYLMEDEGKMVGFCQFAIGEENTIYQVNVDPDCLGKGYGKRLYQFMEEKYREAETKRVDLWSTINAVEFYKKMGFVIVKKIKTKVVELEMDEYLMEKSLG